MPGLASRSWFAVSSMIGAVLRARRYSRIESVSRNGVSAIRKERSFLAPMLVVLVGMLYRLLDTGVRVLPQREWQGVERERYWMLYELSVDVDADGALILPRLAGRPLGHLLRDSTTSFDVRIRAIELAASALGSLHQRGVTHADAMADNVMVDIDSGVARWFDFENVHDERRSISWRKADDVRALLSTCVASTEAGMHADVAAIVVRRCAPPEVAQYVVSSFASPLHRSLPFHLGQAPLSYREFSGLARVLAY